MKKKWLKWEQAYDSRNNSRWYAKAFNGLYFRIQIDLMNNKIIYYEASDDELLLDPKASHQMWLTIENAKYDLDKHHQMLIKQYDTTGSI